MLGVVPKDGDAVGDRGIGLTACLPLRENMVKSRSPFESQSLRLRSGRLHGARVLASRERFFQ